MKIWHQQVESNRTHYYKGLILGALCIAMSSGCAHMETVAHRQFTSRQYQDVGTATVARIDARCGSIFVSEIDGKRIKRDSRRMLDRYFERYQWAWFLTGGFGAISLFQFQSPIDILEVIPGKYVLTVCLYGQSGNLIKSSREPLYLQMTAQAGHHYRLQGSESDLPFIYGASGAWSARLEDITEGKSILVSHAIQRPGSGGLPSSQALDDRAAFEQAVKQKMSNGELHTKSLTFTYPDGATRMIETNIPPGTNNSHHTLPAITPEE